jgi:ligand-binding sensor domain-containing protein/signal transduction histidine kinase
VTGTQAKACATLILLACCPSAFALNPSLDINQYAHNAWTVRDGFFKGTVTSIAQTPDGYLWLGTEFGLLRFDGVRFGPLQPPAGEHLPSSNVRKLLAARDGRLWIGTDEGLVSWKDGKLAHYPELSGQLVGALLEDREGTAWAGGYAIPTGRLCAIQSGNTRCFGEDGSLGRGVGQLYEDSRGSLWSGGATGLWRWKPGPPKRYPTPEPPNALVEGNNGALVISMPSGIRQLVEGKAEAYSLPGPRRQFMPDKLLRDRNGGLWIGTGDRGLLHVHEGRTDVFSRSDGLSGDFIYSLFEDREGNIWVATANGLDRFRDLAVPTISVEQGLSNASVWSVLAARDGSIWLGTLDGLNRWNDGKITIYRKPGSGLPDDSLDSLFEDNHGTLWIFTLRGAAYLENGRFIPVSAVPSGVVPSIVGDQAGNLWISNQDYGLLHLSGGNFIKRTPWVKLGHEDSAYALLPDSVEGGLWLGFSKGGVAYFKDGQVRASYAGADGLGHGRVARFQLDRDGTLWAATEGGLSRVKNGRAATLTSKNGLPCDAVHWAVEDDDHSFWLYMACGLVRIARPELDAWGTDPKRTIQTTVFDSSDGVRSSATTGSFSPRVAKSTNGKLWFLPGDGVSIIDPRHLHFNKLPPPVHIEQIAADRKTYDPASNLRLPALTRDLEIDYTALSLVAPEKNRFRYKLEGYDRDWIEAGNRRQAFYTNLVPRHYRFRVRASNNSGVWNEAGASLDFSVAPAYYQTTWFRASCVVAFFALLWAVYRYRLYQIKHEFNARLEARIGERIRIARDLHDTLLQSFQGCLMKFSHVKYVIRSRPDEAEETLERILDQARAAVTEARDAVQGLRASTVVANDLARAIGTFGESLAADQAGPNCPEFHVQVEGKSRDLPPLIQDEVYHVACESLRNAFRHAQAQRIEVEIRYDPRLFRLRVLDNGKGIDPAVLSAGGRAGHHGLPGVKERAELAGGKLSVWSRVDSGTEIELSIPASIAYIEPATQRRSMSAGKETGL